MTYENESEESNAIGMDKAMLVDEARKRGRECGEYVVTLRTVGSNLKTIGRAAVAWVNRQSLNDMEFETLLEREFIDAAQHAELRALGVEPSMERSR